MYRQEKEQIKSLNLANNLIICACCKLLLFTSL